MSLYEIRDSLDFLDKHLQPFLSFGLPDKYLGHLLEESRCHVESAIEDLNRYDESYGKWSAAARMQLAGWSFKAIAECVREIAKSQGEEFSSVLEAAEKALSKVNQILERKRK